MALKSPILLLTEKHSSILIPVLLTETSRRAFHSAEQPSACDAEAAAAVGEMFNAQHYRKTNSDRIVVSDNLLTWRAALTRSRRADRTGEWAAAFTVVRRPLRYVSSTPARLPVLSTIIATSASVIITTGSISSCYVVLQPIHRASRRQQ